MGITQARGNPGGKEITMDKIELKPCPFCGGKAEYIINSNYERCTTHGWKFGIKCTSCMTVDLKPNGEIVFAKDDRKKAADMWNRRADNG